MLYIFTGSDTASAKKEARRRAEGAEVVFFGEGGEPFSRALHYTEARGLFAPKVVLIIDRPFENEEGKTLIVEYGEALHKVDTAIYVIAGTLSTADKKLFPKGAEFKEYGGKEKTEFARPDTFGLSDAFLLGDKKGMWIRYQKLLYEGVPPEEIHGTLVWTVRSALLSQKTKTAEEAGLKPFVYGKSKRMGEKIGEDGLKKKFRALLFAHHRARAGYGTLSLSLEEMMLGR